MEDFIGVKIAIFFKNDLLVYLRDNKPGLRFAGLWDFPGGGRENNETPVECAIREVDEEFSIKLKPSAIIYEKEYPSMHEANSRAYFMVGEVTKQDIDAISFGAEGQKWQLMKVDAFLSRDDVVPHLKGRLQDYLNLK